MPIPEFVRRLREHVGHEPLWCPGATGVVLREIDGRQHVLLQLRSDFGTWGLIGGMVEPREEPHACLEREALEEAGVVARAERLLWVRTVPRVTFPNGDQVDFLELTYLLRWVDGEPRVADDESWDMRFFPVDALPPMDPRYAEYLEVALTPQPARMG